MSQGHHAAEVDRALPGFPGGTSVSHLCVYDWETPDGLHGGSPHLHTVSTEAYVVTAGRGEVHTLTAEGSAQDPLQPGSLLWFTPGTVHRLVNHGGLEMNVVMSNAGLPEAGDAVLTFPEEIVADAEKYAAAAAIDPHADDATRAEAARTRRDLALEGYEQLLAAIADEGAEAVMGRFYAHATRLVQPKIQRWQEIFEASVQAQTDQVRHQLDALAAGAPEHLRDSAVVRGSLQTGGETPRAYGMCGRLQTWRGGL